MKKLNFKKHMMTGISYMIPMIVAGGILGALAKGFGGWEVGNYAPEAGATIFTNLNCFDWKQFWWMISKLSDYAMSFGVAVMTAGVCYSIAERPGIVPGFIIGYAANQSKAGFLGGLLMAFVIGYFIQWMKTWKLPKWMVGLLPVMIIPVIATFVCGVAFFAIVAKPMAIAMNALQGWIMSLNGGSKFIIGAVIGAGMGFDMGGPVNKTASMAANALGADGIYGPMSAKIIGGMTPPCGVFVSTLLTPKKFSATEKETAKTAFPMGLCFITEGVLPFAAADPARFIPASMIGSALAGGIAVAMGVESVAGHGGIFVFPMMTNWLWAVIALVVGSVATGVIYSAIKKPSEEGQEEEEEIVDLDINL